MSVKIINADVIEWAKNYRGEKFHAAFMDVPYELNFMGKNWDSSGIAFNPDTWAALSEHLLPGAFLFVFAGTLNDDLISVAMRQAGLRKFHKACLWWSYGSGFPKASRIDTAIDRAAGKEQKIIGKRKGTYADIRRDKKTGIAELHGGIASTKERVESYIKEPATPLAKTLAGHRYGLQAIKPAAETILIFQKPYEGKPVDSIVRNGSGALWVDGARIGIDTKEKTIIDNRSGKCNGKRNGIYHDGINKREDGDLFKSHNAGRWPANLILLHNEDDNGTCSPSCPCRELDEQSGKSKSTGGITPRNTEFLQGVKRNGDNMQMTGNRGGLGDTGGASRFFFNADWNHEAAEQISNAAAVRYVAKAARSERNKNVEEFYWRKSKKSSVGFDRITFAEWKKLKPEDRAQGNIHSTVKPISLCKYLATLLLPPNEYAPRRILIPFAGVASEAIGAILAGWEEVTAIEKEKEYCDIGRARVKYWQSHKETEIKMPKRKIVTETEKQESLFSLND